MSAYNERVRVTEKESRGAPDLPDDDIVVLVPDVADLEERHVMESIVANAPAEIVFLRAIGLVEHFVSLEFLVDRSESLLDNLSCRVSC
jgi:hypothetical protein